MVHYNEVGFETYHGQNYFNCHSGTTYEVWFCFGFSYCNIVLFANFYHEGIFPEAAFVCQIWENAWLEKLAHQILASSMQWCSQGCISWRVWGEQLGGAMGRGKIVWTQKGN